MCMWSISFIYLLIFSFPYDWSICCYVNVIYFLWLIPDFNYIFSFYYYISYCLLSISCVFHYFLELFVLNQNITWKREIFIAISNEECILSTISDVVAEYSAIMNFLELYLNSRKYDKKLWQVKKPTCLENWRYIRERKLEALILTALDFYFI